MDINEAMDAIEQWLETRVCSGDLRWVRAVPLSIRSNPWHPGHTIKFQKNEQEIDLLLSDSTECHNAIRCLHFDPEQQITELNYPGSFRIATVLTFFQVGPSAYRV